MVIASSLTLCLVWSASASAQWEGQLPLVVSSGATVSGIGTVTIEQQPTALRLSVDLIGRGKDLKTALAKLADRREAALIELGRLKADPESVKIGDPTLATGTSQQAIMQQNLMQQLIRQRGTGFKLELPKVVKTRARLTAEWPLVGKTGEDLLLLANELQERITAADLGGANEKAELTPEQAEVLEEMEAMMQNYGEQPIKDGQPMFVFVAKITDEQRNAALAEALKKARQRASRLAKAAGRDLGEPLGMIGHSAAVTDYTNLDYQFQHQLSQRFGPGGAFGMADENAAYATQPGTIKVNVVVGATFELK
jgi:uncharacterized protein YggE